MAPTPCIHRIQLFLQESIEVDDYDYSSDGTDAEDWTWYIRDESTRRALQDILCTIVPDAETTLRHKALVDLYSILSEPFDVIWDTIGTSDINMLVDLQDWSPHVDFPHYKPRLYSFSRIDGTRFFIVEDYGDRSQSNAALAKPLGDHLGIEITDLPAFLTSSFPKTASVEIMAAAAQIRRGIIDRARDTKFRGRTLLGEHIYETMENLCNDLESVLPRDRVCEMRNCPCGYRDPNDSYDYNEVILRSPRSRRS